MVNNVSFDNIEAVEAVHISKDGKVWGLTKYRSRAGYLIIPKEKLCWEDLILTMPEKGILRDIVQMKQKKGLEFIEEKNIAKKDKDGKWKLTDEFVTTYKKKYDETDDDEESIFHAAASRALNEYPEMEDEIVSSYIYNFVIDLILSDDRIELDRDE